MATETTKISVPTTRERKLALQGWQMVAESPLELRHADSGSTATGLAADVLLETLEKFDLPLVEYQDSFVLAPRSSGWPMNPEIVNPFVDTGKIVTFTAEVPLDELIFGGIDGLNDYILQAFESSNCTDITNTEFRVIGGSDPSGSWDGRFQGDVVLQVTCVLRGE